MNGDGQQTVASLARRMDLADVERERDRGELSTHEQVCTERYKALEASNIDLKKQLDAMSAVLKGISEAQASSTAVRQALADRPKWWQQVLAAAVVGLIGWMGATIFNMQNARVDAALQRTVPSASVTVNPPQQQIAPPAATAADAGLAPAN